MYFLLSLHSFSSLQEFIIAMIKLLDVPKSVKSDFMAKRKEQNSIISIRIFKIRNELYMIYTKGIVHKKKMCRKESISIHK